MPGMRASINLMCKTCIYDPLQPGTWRGQVEECVSPLCPLFPHRPLSKETTAKNAQKHPKSDCLGVQVPKKKEALKNAKIV